MCTLGREAGCAGVPSSLPICGRGWGGLRAQRCRRREDSEAPSHNATDVSPRYPSLSTAVGPGGSPSLPSLPSTVNSEKSCPWFGLAPPPPSSRAVLATVFLSWAWVGVVMGAKARNSPPPSLGPQTEGRGLCTASEASRCLSGPHFPLPLNGDESSHLRGRSEGGKT